MNWFVAVDRIHLEPSNAAEQGKQDSPDWQSPSDEHTSRSYNRRKKNTIKTTKTKPKYYLDFLFFIFKKKLGSMVVTLHCPLEQAKVVVTAKLIRKTENRGKRTFLR